MKTKTENAVIYARVATRQVGSPLESLSGQVQICEQYCKQKGLKVISHHSEIGVSGVTQPDSRTMLGQAVEDCRKNSAVLVVSHLSRLSRNTLDLFKFKDRLDSIGVHIQPASNEVENDLIARVSESIDEHERAIHSQRIKAGIRHARKEKLAKGTFKSCVRGLSGVYEVVSELPKSGKVISSKRL